VLNCDRSTVKHALQNTQKPRWGAYSALPDLPAGLKGPTSKGRGGKGTQRRGGEGEEKVEEGQGTGGMEGKG